MNVKKIERNKNGKFASSCCSTIQTAEIIEREERADDDNRGKGVRRFWPCGRSVLLVRCN